MAKLNRRDFIKVIGVGTPLVTLGAYGISVAAAEPPSAAPAIAAPSAPSSALAAAPKALPWAPAQLAPANIKREPTRTEPANLMDYQPARMESADGVLEAELVAAYNNPVVNGRELNVRNYNGGIPAPTLVARPGDVMRIRHVNNLPAVEEQHFSDVNIPHGFNVVNLHTHGLNVSPEGNEDNVLVSVNPGEVFYHEFYIPADHPTGHFWYHPHKHGAASNHLSSGMAGNLLIEGDGQLSEIPEVGAAQEVLLMFQEMYIAEDNTVFDFPFGGHIPQYTVNGLAVNEIAVDGSIIPPEIHMRPGEVQRWRLCHAGLGRNFHHALQGHQVHILAYDGITQEKAEAVDDFVFVSGQRLDVLVKAGEPGTYPFLVMPYNQGLPPFPRKPMPMFNLVVEGEPMDMALPTDLNPPTARLPYIGDDEIVRRRNITFDVTGELTFNDAHEIIGNTLEFKVNGRRFDPNYINETVLLNTAEEWVITSTHHEDHPFHVHVNWFQVMEIDGVKLDPPRWMDTVNVPKGTSVVVRQRFEHFSGLTVFHCHILLHEDLGMMALLDIVDPAPMTVPLAPSGGTFVSNDAFKRVSILFPPNSVSADTEVTYTHQDRPAENLGKMMGVDRFFELSATQGGESITDMDRGAIISVQYALQTDPEVLDNLRLYRLDGMEWTAEGINTLSRTGTSLTSTITELGQYAVCWVCGPDHKSQKIDGETATAAPGH